LEFKLSTKLDTVYYFWQYVCFFLLPRYVYLYMICKRHSNG
jgi:hypothetical protein